MKPDEQQFRDFYALHSRDIWRYCLRRLSTPQEAEGIFNATFTVAWKKFDAVPEGDQARPWLYVAARNEIRNSRRKSERYTELKRRVRAHRSPAPPTDPADLASTGQEHVRDALNRLGPKDRELLMLAAWERLPRHELAFVLGCSENAVAIRLHRARARLAEELGTVPNEREVKRSPSARRVAGQGAIKPRKGSS